MELAVCEMNLALNNIVILFGLLQEPWNSGLHLSRCIFTLVLG